MGLALVRSRTLLGLSAQPVQVEVHLANGLPQFTLVGLADTEVKEARERVRSALHHSGLGFPHNQRITVNLAPADMPKASGRFDLPMALGILAAQGLLDTPQLDHLVVAGELSLAGDLRPVRGGLAMGLSMLHQHSASSTSHRPITLVLPPESAEEAALVPGIRVVRARHLRDVVAHLQPGGQNTCPSESDDGWALLESRRPHHPLHYPDLRDVRGQAVARRALEIAAAGGHHLLLYGPPGTGKSLLAHRLMGILPPLNEQEALESASIAALGRGFSVMQWGRRPFCAPHHSASAAALTGSGSPPRPGEISLAHHGVLFLDELPEFSRMALEALREPLETGHIRIARAHHHTEFPAAFQLLAAMNPCPCGFLGHPTRRCRCTPEQVQRYRHRLSGPLMDRIDLHVEVGPVPATVLLGPEGESSEQVRQRVLQARERACVRQGRINQSLQGEALAPHKIGLSPSARERLLGVAERLGWSGRGTQRTLRVARTIADLARSEWIESDHLAEALQYRPPSP